LRNVGNGFDETIAARRAFCVLGVAPGSSTSSGSRGLLKQRNLTEADTKLTLPKPTHARAVAALLAAVSFTAAALAPSSAGAQDDPPPGAAADDPPPGAASEEAPLEPEPPAEGAEDEFTSSDYGGVDEEVAEEDAAPEQVDADPERRRSLFEYSSLSGGSGLMRVMSATSGRRNTFRFSLLTGFYSGSGFLCPQCPDSNGGGTNRSDEVDRVSANFYLSATPLDFLEAYLGIYSQSTSDSLGEPELLQVVGDWSLGAKAFLPPKEDQILSAGGALELGFATGSGQVGAASVDSVNIALRGLATLDLTRRAPESRLPLRAHVNLGYLFDNSGNLVEDFEAEQGTISRIQRFSLDVNRVDSFQIGLGAEGMFEVVRPYLEWTIDVPTNRQGYVCTRPPTNSGDQCLRDLSTIAAMPSRLTAGVRTMPWLEGLSFNAAVDVATGGTSQFLVEIAPEVPWSLWVGLGYAVDPTPRVVLAPVAAPAAPSAVAVEGIVVEKGGQTGIANAEVRFEGRELTGLITTADGHFTSSALEPGSYTLKVSASGYKEATCKANVARSEVPPPADGGDLIPRTTPASAEGDVSGEELVPATASTAPTSEPVRCELEPIPKVANLDGAAVDATTGVPVPQAKVRIVDVLGRALELRVDDAGAFRFENVPPGTATLTIQAPGYLRSVTEVKVEALRDQDRRFGLHRAPEKPSVRIANNQIVLDRPIEFETGTAVLTPPSVGVVQELALLLSEQPTLGQVEVQSHTASAGPAEDALSLERANTVRDALVLQGAPSGMLVAKGYGGTEPARPGTTEEARKANERVRLKVLSTNPAPAAAPPAAPGTPAIPVPTLPGGTTPLPSTQPPGPLLPPGMPPPP
jgi:outer membrane protein OmpA-like peptidoglycan-associated protein